ncbi:TolC family outer membrane protein [Pseudoduganella sp.]|uniref:TolC family outer membrane protein n=1 Tax=Pseudoduganella sp. TaxID=1880898 RepID=UPI0035B4E8F8
MARFNKMRMLPLATGIALALGSTGASALSLQQAYEAALKNDPAYQAAVQVNAAGRENRVLGKSALLPTVSGAFSANKNRTTVERLGKTEPQDYTSRSATVQLRQPLFSLEALAKYKQGVAQSEYAEAVLDSQSQEVIMRVSGAYFEVLLKQYNVALAEIERDTYLEQRNVNDFLYKKGEGTRTDMLETQSRLHAAEAQLLEAKDAQVTAEDALAGIVGGEVGQLDTLRGDFRATSSGLMSFEDWKASALAQNPDVRALEKNVEIARQEINKQRSGHLPRVDFVGTYGQTASETLSLINQDQTIRSIGVQLNVPIFNGGAVSALSRQAVANHEKAKADLQAQKDKVTTELRKNYNQLVSSVSRIEAHEKSVESAKLLITATEQSIKGGVRINLDLLNAKRQLYTAQRDLALARFGYLLANLRLKAAAGVLTAEDVRLTAAYFN